MTTIVPLLLKDIRIQKKNLAIGVLFMFAVIFLSGAFENLPAAVPAVILGHFLIMFAAKTDERGRGAVLLHSLPLRRLDVVVAKYAGLFLFAALGFGTALLCRAFSLLLLPGADLPRFDTSSIGIALAALLVFYAIYYPLYFRFGGRIVQVLDMLVIIASIVAGFLLFKLSLWLGDPFFGLPDWLTQQSGAVQYGLPVVFVTVLLLVSFLLSAAFYGRRDL
ncbi:MAG: ABC-2 transporter permease [Paenibacillaceae bacterium]|nr:ABC-2 transporter permease [Paenibacillaceae bacterium]